MEAAVADKEAGTMEWNDGRFDDLSDRVDRIETKMDQGFARIEEKMDAGFARIDAKFDTVNERFEGFNERFDGFNERFDGFNERFDGMHRMLFKVSWAMVVGLLGLLGVLIGVVAAQG